MARLYHFPEDLEQIISARAREEASGADTRSIAESIRELSDLFNGKVSWDARYHRDRRLRHAYLGYFLPVNLPKIRLPLGQWIAAQPGVWAGRPLRALDLGSGPGTALLGLADFVRDLPRAERPVGLDLVATDLSPENLRDAETLLERFAAVEPELPPLRFQALRTDLVADRSGLFPVATAGGRFDLVVAANVLCELVREGDDGLDRAEALIRAVVTDALASGGAIVLLEPGLRDTSRDLHRLRDRLVGGADLHVHAPCLHQQACPALAHERDWCYRDLAWETPRRIADLDRRTGLRKDVLKFSYLLLSPRAPAASAPERHRLVSEVRDLKGERRLYLCAGGRWRLVSQLKRERGAHETVLRELERGDLVEIEGLEERGELFRLPASGSIRRVEESPPGLGPSRTQPPRE